METHPPPPFQHGSHTVCGSIELEPTCSQHNVLAALSKAGIDVTHSLFALLEIWVLSVHMVRPASTIEVSQYWAVLHRAYEAWPELITIHPIFVRTLKEIDV